MSLQKRILWISLVLIGTASRIGIAADVFDATSVGNLPSDRSAAKTGIGEGSVLKIQEDCRMKGVGRTTVGKAPKRVAFVPAITR